MRTSLFWVHGPWRGRLAIMSRPRGGDWLEDEIHQWRSAGVDVVVSLLTDAERAAFDLNDEAAIGAAAALEVVRFPLPAAAFHLPQVHSWSS